jgi:hypothetical protein
MTWHWVPANREGGLVLTVPHVDRLHVARGDARVSKGHHLTVSRDDQDALRPRGHRRILHQCLHAGLAPTFPMLVCGC